MQRPVLGHIPELFEVPRKPYHLQQLSTLWILRVASWIAQAIETQLILSKRLNLNSRDINNKKVLQ